MTLRLLTKAAKTRRVKAILERGPGPVDSEDAQWLVAEVFSNHPRWGEKRGCGRGHVEIRKMPPYGALAFWLVRSDGTCVDISYRESLRPSTHHAKVMSAARCEIEHDVGVWKARNPMPAPGMHCDHVYPFEALFAAFLSEIGMSEGDLSVIPDAVGRADHFENRDFAGRWQSYHLAKADLQWLPAKENIAKSNKVEELEHESV